MSYSSLLKQILSCKLISCLAGIASQGVSAEDSLSLAASLASIPKSWPESCTCMTLGLEDELKDRLTKEKKEMPKGYLSFVRQEIKKLFPKGMQERDLNAHARRVTPPFTSTTENGCRDGGSYASWEGRREDYFSQLEKPRIIHQPKFMVANAPGKPRPLVKNSPTYLLLRPVHTFLYDTLSRQPWLLRGPPKRKVLLKAGFSPRQGYFSADFTAATDNLPIEVAEVILDTIMSRSHWKVLPLLVEAKKSLRPTISFTDSTIVPTVGQLMGNLCSFPLLCLQNYLATQWVDKQMGTGKTPILINGDDLVAQVSKEWTACYRSWAPRLGFTLNDKKTSYSNLLNINSTYFTSNFKEIPFLRCAGLGNRDPRSVGKIMSDLLRPFSNVRNSRTQKISYHLGCYFKRQIHQSGKTLYSLDYRRNKRDQIALPRDLKKREKERSGWGYRPFKIPAHPMGLNLVQFVDEFKVSEDREIAEAVVSEHWEGGHYEAPVREKLREIKQKCKEEKQTRNRGLTMAQTMERLREGRKEKSVWIPAKLEDCYSLSHDTVTIEDGFVVERECKFCDRVRAIRLRIHNENYLNDSIEDSMRAVDQFLDFTKEIAVEAC
ncbi:RNA-dependent RNA polymerase [Erysiphe necator associated ourmia-like virus 128]|nr:RNA-dependent RNA polymerase [Erysiphe necator associated ourmia-like virus 128]